GNARTFAPAPSSRNTPPKSVVRISAARAAAQGSSMPPIDTAPASCTTLADAPRKRRRDQRDSVMTPVRVDGRIHARLAERPDVDPDALRRAEYGPVRRAVELDGRAELAQDRRLLVVDRRLQRHERHEAPRLRVVERRQAVLILRVQVDPIRGELLDDLLVALADRVMQRRAAADFLHVVDQ